MAKVNINGHSHQVELEAEEPIQELVKLAQSLWKETTQPENPRSGGIGFHSERRASWDVPHGFEETQV